MGLIFGLPLGIMFFFIILSLTIVIGTTNLLTMTRQPTTGWRSQFRCSTFHSHIIINNNNNTSKRSTSTSYVFFIAFFTYYSYILDTKSTDNNSTEERRWRWREKNSIENGRGGSSGLSCKDGQDSPWVCWWILQWRQHQGILVATSRGCQQDFQFIVRRLVNKYSIDQHAHEIVF